MKGYSFKSLTDLVLKIFGTKINAGTGLSGGGSLEADRTLSVKYGTTAGTATQGNDSRVVNAASNATVNAKEAALEAKKADKTISITASTGLSGGGTLAASRSLAVKYGTAAGTAAQGNDSRLSNSREWTGSTISQAEAEAGTATTRRAFTAQRVRQAIVAWFNGISGALGRTILTRTTAAQVRSDIGLGTAATRNVGTASGNVMGVGAFGLGATTNPLMTGVDCNTLTTGGTYLVSVAPNAPDSSTWVVTVYNSHQAGRVVQEAVNSSPHSPTTVKYFRTNNTGGTWSAWVEIHHTGNILTSTGQSTNFPMTQKATTDQLATKANTTTQVIAGTGLTGGGTLAANRTLNVSYGTAAGTAAQGNDSRIVNATPNSRAITAGTGLSGGGNLTANRTISISSGAVPLTATSLGTNNLNSMQTAGYYFQRANANATTARNYPPGGQAGTLVVTTAAGVIQEYTTYGLNNRKYTRGFYNSSWSAWREIGAVPSWAAVTGKPATATRWPAFTEVTGRPANYPTTWASVAAKPAQATRWPTWAEVTSKPVVQTVGASTTNIMSQKAVTDALTSQGGQISMTGSAALNGATNNTVQLTGIVTTLGLEVGDVIRIQYSGYNKLHTVEYINNNNSVRVNYEHAGNRGNGSLKLANRTVSVTITRIAKWYNAPIGMGQTWLDVTGSRVRGTTYTNSTGRPIMVAINQRNSTGTSGSIDMIVVDGIEFDTINGSDNSIRATTAVIVPNGSVYKVIGAGTILTWAELR